MLSTPPIRRLCYDSIYMDKQKQIWVWIGVVVVAAAVAFGIWHFTHPPSLTAVYAPKGQLTGGFPKDLILDNAAQISDSYSINYDASTNQYTADWSSNSSMATLDAMYKNYFAQNGWKIVNDAENVSTWRGLYATKGSTDANVTISSKGKGSEVSISYLEK